MEQASLLIVAMAEQCKDVIQQPVDTHSNLPEALHPRRLLWMCQSIQQHAEDWPAIRLHRWIGFVQCGMMANRMLDLKAAKAMFNDARKSYGEIADDPDLVDHLDAGGSFQMELGGQG